MKEKFLTFGNKFLRHELVSGSFYIFIGSMIANVLAFFLNLFFARTLSYVDYGIFASLLSVITLAVIPSNSINTVIVRFATDYFSKNNIEKGRLFYAKMAKFIFLLSLVIFLIFSVFVVPLNNFLHLDNLGYLFLVGLIIATFYLNVLNNAFLQSLLRFSFMSFILIFGGLVKLISGLALVISGFRVFGALWSIFFMTAASILLGFLPLRFLLRKHAQGTIINPIKEILKYAIPASISVFFLTSLISIDVILVKHFFSAHDAGFYAGLSLIGRVIFYFTAPIPLVMFPLVIKRYNVGRGFNNLFYLALFLVTVPSFAITAVYFLFPKLIVDLFLGGRDYLVLIPYVGLFGVFMSVFSLVNVCVNFFLSLNRTEISPIIIIGAIAQVILIFLFHNSFYQIIGISLGVCSVIFVILMLYYFKLFGSWKEFKQTIALASNPNL